jgi:hypothetical protein
VSAQAAYEGPLLVTPGNEDVAESATEGAGVVSSVADLRTALGGGDPGEIASAASGAALDALGAAMDPLDALAAAGVGWLIEHVAFLHEGLDVLAGDPIQIRAQAQTWHNVSAALRSLAEDYRADVDTLTGWDGAAAVGYRLAATDHVDGLHEGAARTAALSDELLLAGAQVGTVRALVRDLIVEVVVELVVSAAIALASSVASLGSSLAAFVGWAVARAAMTAATIAARIAELLVWLAAASARIARGAAAFHDVAAAVPGSTGRAASETADRAAALGVEAWKQGEQAEAQSRAWADPRPREWERLVAEELRR